MLLDTPWFFSAAALVAWLVFALTAERISPFDKPRGALSRRRWRLGRRFAVAVLAAAAILWAAIHVFPLPGWRILIALGVFVVVAVPALLSYQRPTM